jgi:vacuolar-type H+-ATPase subunit I/STV1
VATVLLIPLHLVWALGIPRWAGVQRLHAWHQGGGGTYLFMLILLALFPGALALALAHPWESVFPRWLPVVAGRAVPRLLLIVPAVALAVFLLAYAVFATIVLPQQWNDPGVFFSSWIVAFGLAQFPIWAIGLLVATRAYARRTAPRRSARLAPSGGREALPQLARVRAH